jgi:hypothetical protein
VLPIYSGAELYKLSIWKQCPETCRVLLGFYGVYSDLVRTGEVVSRCVVARTEELLKMCEKAFRSR